MKPNTLSMLYESMPLKNKLLLSYVLFLAVPIIVLSIISMHSMEAMVEQQIRVSSQFVVEQVLRSIENELNMALDTGRSMAVQSGIREVLSKDPDAITMSEQIDDFKLIRSTIESYKRWLGSQRVRVFVNDGFHYSRSKPTVFPLSAFWENEWSTPLRETAAPVCISPAQDVPNVIEGTMQVVSVCVPVKHIKNLVDICAVVSVDVPTSVFLEQMETINASRNASLALIDENCRVVVGQMPGNSVDIEYVHIVSQAEEGAFVVQGNIVCIAPLAYNGWRVVNMTPIAAVLRQTSGYRSMLIGMSLLLGVLVYLCAWKYSQRSTLGIRQIQAEMERVKHGDYHAMCIVDRLDEIGELQQGFNAMVHKMNSLLDEQTAFEKERREMALKLLQSKINPHFLYNTLDLIAWSADDPQLVRTLVVNLSQFYRLSLSGGSDFIPLEEEIEHVRMYTNIQNIRYQSSIHLLVDLPEELRTFPVMKILLQPIVENSILHGLRPKFSDEGEIHIRVSKKTSPEGERICLCIHDNGVGFAGTASARNSVSSGYGLNNIRERLAMYYGDRATLALESNHGALVRIELPAELTASLGGNPL